MAALLAGGLSLRQAILIVVAALLSVVAIRLVFENERHLARSMYISESAAAYDKAKDTVESQLLQIYRNIRTLAALPGVRKIDRHATNVDNDTLETFQQVYNNLASSVAVSEVYIVPESLDPDRIDPVTGKPEEPILMFDHLIFNGGQVSETLGGLERANLQPEIEIHEYRQYRRQFEWFRKYVPDIGNIQALSVPMLSGGEVITCDNTIYNKTLEDRDRMGLSFAVPFYGMDGKLKGSVVAVVLTRNILAMLPRENYALVHIGNGYLAGASGVDKAAHWAARGEADPAVMYSRADALSVPDGNGGWKLWISRPDSDFWQRSDVRAIAFNERLALVGVVVLGLAALVVSWLMGRNRALRREMLEQRFDLLAQIAAKISHEIRNPLAAVRNSLFMIRRTASDNGNIVRHTERAERGISRCDQLIGELLDYTRRDPFQPVPMDVCATLEELLPSQALPGEAPVAVVLPPHPVMVSGDPSRLGRAVLNLIDNAASIIAQSGKGSRITVTCRDANGRVLIEVADDGPGIAPDVLKDIFKPLYTTKSFAAGLGLPVARDIVTLHGGELTVASTLGKGSTFTISIPSATAELKKAA